MRLNLKSHTVSPTMGIEMTEETVVEPAVCCQHLDHRN